MPRRLAQRGHVAAGACFRFCHSRSSSVVPLDIYMHMHVYAIHAYAPINGEPVMAEAEAAAIDLLEARAEPVPKRKSVATPNQVLAIVCVGICLANLDLFIVNVGLPHIAR